MDILICTDGTDSSVKAADMVTKFSFPRTTKITILGVGTHSEEIEKLTQSMELIEENIGNRFDLDKKIRHGDPIEEILAEAVESSYDLVVIGGGGAQLELLDPQVGTTTGQLARKLSTHFLVVRNIPGQFEKVLFCAGADVPASDTMRLGGKWISNTNAQVGLLHVVPVSRIGSSNGTDDQKQSKDFIEQCSQKLREAGIKSRIESHIRSGMVVDEVLKELSEGKYELLVIGSHYLPGHDIWRGMLFDDVTDQLIKRSTCSVLII